MKKCEEKVENEDNFPNVHLGDVVNIRDSGYYLVCHSDEIVFKLINLESGCTWCRTSTWGSVDPKRVRKVNVCFKECD